MAKKKKVVRKKTTKKVILKKPKVVYSSNRQTNVKNYDEWRDMNKPAMPSGKRIPKGGGKPYYEYRKNRTDAPDSLTGVKEKMLKDLFFDFGVINGKLIFWQNQLPSKNKTAQIKILKNSLKNIKKNIVVFKKLK
jgi:hypothetical protein